MHQPNTNYLVLTHLELVRRLLIVNNNLAGNALGSHIGCSFTATDYDYDTSAGNYAVTYTGGW